HSGLRIELDFSVIGGVDRLLTPSYLAVGYGVTRVLFIDPVEVSSHAAFAIVRPAFPSEFGLRFRMKNEKQHGAELAGGGLAAHLQEVHRGGLSVDRRQLIVLHASGVAELDGEGVDGLPTVIAARVFLPVNSLGANEVWQRGVVIDRGATRFFEQFG